MSGLDAVVLANKDYVAEQYRRYQADPSSVDEAWALFFAGFELGAEGNGHGPEPSVTATGDVPDAAQEQETVAAGITDLVHSYRELGHLVAHLNPLAPKPAGHPLLEPEEFGFSEADLDRVVEVAPFRGATRLPLRELIARLETTYCGTLGVEYLHIQEKAQRQWMAERMEPTLNKPDLTVDDRVSILNGLISAETFEQFLGRRYPTGKRFSLEGADALVPLLDDLIESAGTLGVEEMVFGMAHRGRLNVLANVLRKPYEMILSEFEGAQLSKEATGDGDVKYHLGYSRDHTTRAGHKVHLSLGANPSHLEAIDPVIEGIVRAKQTHLADLERRRVVPVLMHGDAAFTGQGVVSETLWLSELAGYRVGGTIHVIIDNQIGFTTPPASYRFTRYPSDLAKIIQAPIFHVNGDDPESAVQAARLAIAFRQRFKKDAIINLICYRRHGHNELDDPTFTQPVMYAQIAAKPTALTIYRQRLTKNGTISDADADAGATDFREILDAALSYARDFMPRQPVFAFGGLWKGLGWAGSDWSARTAVAPEVLEQVAASFTRFPPDFTPHPKALKIMEQRVAMVRDGNGIDWGCAEALAIGSLALEGLPIRLTGQDVCRGTFSHRHAVLHDVHTGYRWTPVQHVRGGQGQVTILDSMLSENAVVGFELGYSLADPNTLVIWEARFGDFANGAQVVIDQFIASAESKWQRMTGLVMLLPHGYEGQGPEHSSARLERYLQLCAEDNMQVVNLTTPAQYFHALRRQLHRTFRKPLIIMSPKSMLRHKLVVSTLRDFTDGSFQSVIDDIAVDGAPETGITLDRNRVTRILLSSGKIYYELLAGRRERAVDTAALVRVEQLYPFPAADLGAIFRAYPNAQQFYWVQEEPWNMGGWHTMYRRIRRLLPEGTTLEYIGRAEAASPASGNYKVHMAEEAELVRRAFAR